MADAEGFAVVGRAVSDSLADVVPLLLARLLERRLVPSLRFEVVLGRVSSAA